jgi:hypothetical protein
MNVWNIKTTSSFRLRDAAGNSTAFVIVQSWAPSGTRAR